MHEVELRHTIVVVVGGGQHFKVAEEFGKSFAFKILPQFPFVLRCPVVNSRGMSAFVVVCCLRVGEDAGKEAVVGQCGKAAGRVLVGGIGESRDRQAGRMTGICRPPQHTGCCGLGW